MSNFLNVCRVCRNAMASDARSQLSSHFKSVYCVCVCALVLLILWGPTPGYMIISWGHNFLKGTKSKSLQSNSGFIKFQYKDLV